MKRIFKLTTVFALAGALLLSGSCTKDYGEEIASVKKDLQTLTDGTVATHTSQIAAINKEIEALQEMDKTLQSAIAKVDTEYKAAVAELKAAIEKKATEAAITALQDRCTKLEDNYKALDKQVAVNKEAIDGLKTLVAAKADESWVKLTFATKAELETVSTNLGSLSVTVSNIEADYKEADAQLQKNIDTVSEDLATAKKELSEAIALKADQTYVDAIKVRVASLEVSLAALEKRVKANEDAIVAINGELVTIKADIKTNQDNIKTLQGEVENLWKNFDNYYTKGEVDEMITTLTNRTKYVDSILFVKWAKEKAAREAGDSLIYVRIQAEVKTLQDQLDILNNDIIPALQQADEDLDKKINGVQKSLSEEIIARMTKDAALQDSINKVVVMYQEADAALQEQIDVLRKYSMKGDSTLNAKIKQETENRIQAISETKSEITNFVKELVGLEDASAGSLKAILEAKIQKNETDIAALQEEIEKISKETIAGIASRVSTLEEQVSALQARVTSISVKPTKIPEIITLKVGSIDTNMIRASFVVEPASAVQTVIANNGKKITLSYTEGLPRYSQATKTKVPQPLGDLKAEIVKVEADGNTVTVIAKGIQDLRGGITKTIDYSTAYYFSFNFNDGDYAINSDFAQAVQSENIYDLVKDYPVFFHKDAKGNLYGNDEKRLAGSDTTDYITAKTIKYTPYKNFSFVVKNTQKNEVLMAFLGDKERTLDEFQSYTGIPMNYNGHMDYKVSDPLNFNSPTKWQDFEVTYNNKLDLSDYINTETEPYKTSYISILNQANVACINNAYTITRVRHLDTLDAMHLCWNYKTYKSEDRKDTISDAKLRENANWSRANSIEYRAKAEKELTDFTLGKGPGKYAHISVGDWDKSEKDYYSRITIAPASKLVNSKICEDSFSIIKKNKTDDYKFVFPVTVDTVMKAQEASTSYSIDGSVTKPTVLPVKDFAKNFVCDNNGSVKPALIHGLSSDESTETAVMNAFKANIDMSQSLVYYKKNGYFTQIPSDSFGFTYNEIKDSLALAVMPGYFQYNEKDTVKIESTIFNVKYTFYVYFETKAPKFKIATLPYVVDSVATVHGAITAGGEYTLNDIKYNQHVEIQDISNANEKADSKYTVKFIYSTEENTSGSLDNSVGEKGVEVDANGRLLEDAYLLWGSYDGRKPKMKAQVYINDTPVTDCYVEYYIQTDDPIDFVTAGKIDTVKSSGSNLRILLTQKCVVNGIVEGKFDRTKNLVTPEGKITTDPFYGVDGASKTEFAFVDENMKSIPAKINGQDYTLAIDRDYKWEPDTYTLELIIDQIVGTVEFDIDIPLNCYLDYKHTKAKSKTLSVKFVAQ